MTRDDRVTDSDNDLAAAEGVMWMLPLALALWIALFLAGLWIFGG
jgi:hypothetical protein